MDETDPKNYTKREIDHWFKDLFNRLDKQDVVLSDIKGQTIKTNGRVTSLEGTRIQMWTAISVLLILGGTIITLAINSINYKIERAVSKALTDNVKEINYEQ